MKVSSNRHVNRCKVMVAEENACMGKLYGRTCAKFPLVDYSSYIYNDKPKWIRAKRSVEGFRR